MTRLREEKIQKFKDGDDYVFPEIFSRYQNKIYYLAVSILHNEADSEEAVQNTFIEVIANRASLRDVRSFNFWLYQIAYHNILDIYRKNKRNSTTRHGETILENYSDQKSDSNDIIRNKLLFELILKEIDKLPIEMREVCLLRFINEFSIDEISGIMSIPVGTVKSRLHRSKKQLKVELSKHHVMPI
ncbi:RNA polymerase sigma factor [Breznakia pachnodae]|uniref:RNA polymerase sigma-70 factor (ECF subfamily) n=1 Tax=Breznakia pachnodae TaxID=265178 RepID=A0ABU0E0W2_9FIRM|nr:RNA polymerase sigma factor [Breznakia pachnodae]MDQ0360450.1 RNA polymerase sigma-70 factor (ECF subfamily) [Breznakia pachnodae]